MPIVYARFRAVTAMLDCRCMAQPSDPLSLRIGYWMAVHRTQLKTWWAISIILIDLALIGIFFVMFTAYSFSTTKIVRDIAAMSTPLVSSELRTKIAPVEIEFGDGVALSRSPGRYDLTVPVKNPNPQFVATEARFAFTFGPDRREASIILWPSEEAYVAALNVPGPTGGKITPPKVELVHVSWQRPERLKLFTDDIHFELTETSVKPVTGLTTGGVATRFSSKLKNSSIYGFRSVRFGVVLRDGSAVVAVGDVTVENLKSFETREIDFTWLQALPTSASPTVFPIVNLLDPGIYLTTR